MSEDHHRSTDGATLIKIFGSIIGTLIMLLVAIIAYVYISDRDVVQSIANNVGEMREQQIINSAYLKNVDARIEVNKNAIGELHKEATAYWRK